MKSSGPGLSLWDDFWLEIQFIDLLQVYVIFYFFWVSFSSLCLLGIFPFCWSCLTYWHKIVCSISPVCCLPLANFQSSEMVVCDFFFFFQFYCPFFGRVFAKLLILPFQKSHRSLLILVPYPHFLVKETLCGWPFQIFAFLLKQQPLWESFLGHCHLKGLSFPLQILIITSVSCILSLSEFILFVQPLSHLVTVCFLCHARVQPPGWSVSAVQAQAVLTSPHSTRRNLKDIWWWMSEWTNKRRKDYRRRSGLKPGTLKPPQSSDFLLHCSF